MGFLEGELNDGGDGFLEGLDDDEGSFLEGVEEQERVSRPPHPYGCSNKELVEKYWDDGWYDVTDSIESMSSSMKRGFCGGCGHKFCVAKSNRSFECWKCGSFNIDFGWEDARIDTSDREDFNREKMHQ